MYHYSSKKWIFIDGDSPEMFIFQGDFGVDIVGCHFEICSYPKS